MGKIYVIMGKSATGKDTVYQRILSEYKELLRPITLYTTRPKRSAEIDGRDYYFVSEQEYLALKAENKVIEERAYDTVHGVWRYFTVDDGNINTKENNYILVATLEAYQNIKKYFGEDFVYPIYLEIDNGVRLERALEREKKQKEPKYTELCRRFLADEEDFSEEKIKAAGIVKKYPNESLEECIQMIEQNVLNHLK